MDSCRPSYYIPDEESDQLSSFTPSESDTSTLFDLKKRVKELDGLLDDMEGEPTDDEADITNDQLFTVQNLEQVGGILERSNDVYSEYSERTDDLHDRERSEQLLRQELDAVDMVHSLSGLYWKKYYAKNAANVSNDETRKGTSSRQEKFSNGDVERQIPRDDIQSSDGSDNQSSMPEVVVVSVEKRNRKILVAQIVCAIFTIIIIIGITLLVFQMESTGREADKSLVSQSNSGPSPLLSPTSAPINSLPTLGENPLPLPTEMSIDQSTPTLPKPNMTKTALPTLASMSSIPTKSPSRTPIPSPTDQHAPDPTKAPTSQPSVADVPPSQTILPSSDERIALVHFLRDIYGVEFGDPSSPANFAVDWLVGESGGIKFDFKLAQRFALVTLDFALDANSMLNWSTEDQEACLWQGVSCNEDDFVSELRFGGLALSGTIPPEISILDRSLTYADISDNQLQGSLPEELYDLTYLQTLYLYKNQLTGTISSKLGDLVKLTHAHLSHNQFSGTIPDSIKKIDPLRYLNVYRNQLTGSIPRYLKDLSKLFLLDLGHNQLTGTLPAEIGGKNTALKHLHLDHNQFVGTIPPSYTQYGMETLSLDHNQLVGSVPSDYSSMSELVSFTLQQNDFAVPLNNNTCRLSVFDSGQIVEFQADCEICSCRGTFCKDCP